MVTRRHPLRGLLAVLIALPWLATRPAMGQSPANFDDEVLARVNQIRQSYGLTLLVRNARLDVAAQLHAEDMARNNFMSHYGSDGSNPGVRIRAAGYAAMRWGENVAYGYKTPAAVMNGWMNSPGHRANILNPNVREIGIGVAYSPGTRRYYWCQEFGARKGTLTPAAPPVPEAGDAEERTSPRIEAMTPDAGLSGTRVVLTGHGFGDGAGSCLVLFGVMGSAQLESWSDTRIVVLLFNASPGPGTIRVCNDGKTSNAMLFRIKE